MLRNALNCCSLKLVGKTELEKEYLGLPLRIERERQRERQRTIEASIAEIDAAIRKFSEADVS